MKSVALSYTTRTCIRAIEERAHKELKGIYNTYYCPECGCCTLMKIDSEYHCSLCVDELSIEKNYKPILVGLDSPKMDKQDFKSVSDVDLIDYMDIDYLFIEGKR